MSKQLIICMQPEIKKYMIEYINSFLHLLEKSFTVSISCDTQEYSINIIYMFLQSVPNNFPKKANNIILINTEQCTRNEYKIMLQNMLDNNMTIFDYSIENIKLLNNNENMLYFPYQYNHQEINILKNNINIATEKLFDVACIGCPSQRRESVCKKLAQKGVRILYNNNLWGEMRDKVIASCKILLNIHYNENYNVYEHIRCDRWVFSGMLVVSENSLDNSMIDMSNIVYFEKYENLVDLVMEILGNYNVWVEKYKAKYDLALDEIIKNREIEFEKISGIINEKSNEKSNEIN